MASYLMISLLWAVVVWLLSSPTKRSLVKSGFLGLIWPGLVLLFLVSTVAWAFED